MKSITLNNAARIFITAFILSLFYSHLSAQELKPADKYMLAAGFEQSGNYEKAREIFEELLNEFPADYNYLSSLNRVYLKNKDYEGSIRIISKRLNENPADYNSYGLLGNTFYVKGEIESAYAEWEKGINTNPKSVVPYRAICAIAVQNRAYDKAIEFYLRGERELNNTGLFIGEIFNLYTFLNKSREAVEYLCNAIDAKPEAAGIGKSVFYSLSFRSGIADEYVNMIAEKKRESGKKAFKELLAFIYQLRGENEKALGEMKEIDAVEKNGTAVYNFGMESFGYRNYGAASIALKYIVENYPKAPFYVQARIYYPKSLEMSIAPPEVSPSLFQLKPDSAAAEKYREVIKAYEETASAFPHSENRNEALLRIGIIQKEIFFNIQEAEKKFEEIKKSNIYAPSRNGAILNLAEIKMTGEDPAGAEELLLDMIQKNYADSASVKKAHYLLGKTYFYGGNFGKAVEHLNEAAYDFGNELSNDAIELSVLINAARKDSLSLLEYAGAERLIERREFEKGGEILKKTSLSENFFIVDVSRFRYAEILAKTGHYPEAAKLMEEISSLDNSNYADNAYFSLGNILFYAVSDLRGSKSSFEKLLASYPSSIYADKAREMINLITNKLEKIK